MIMSNCTTKSVYESIEACPGKKTLAGIRRRIFYIEKSSIVTFPKLPAMGEAEVKMKDLAVYKESFVLVEGKFWKFIDLKPEASNVTYETAGEVGSKIFNNQANAIVAGQSDEVKGFARQSINEDIVYVYQNRDGGFSVIGNESFETQTTASGDTTSEATGASISTFAISCYDNCPVPTYVGKLPISATEAIDCATGLTEAIGG